MTQNKWTWQLPFLLFLCVATVFVIRRHAPAGSLARPVGYQHSEGNVFGTVWHATYQCDSSLRHSIVRELRRVDASLSMFNPKSTLSRINRGETTEMDSLLCIVLTQAMQVSRETEGCFDVTVAPLVNAWGFGFKHDALPDSAQVDSLRRFVGWQGLTVEDNRLTKADERMVIDLSAIAKGFGTDQVASLFNRHGIRNYMIEIGGEIVVRGRNPKGEPWNIGVSKPVEDSTSLNQEILTTLRLTDCAMATSGNYRNYYVTPDGHKLAHTIDPHTGYPVRHTLLSSTVVAPVCSMADAFATAFMVMGLERAREVLGRHPELRAYLVYSDGEGALKVWGNLENNNEKNGK